jgi:hypothetical protein
MGVGLFYFTNFYQMSSSAIFNQCDAKGQQVCRGSLGENRKEERKKIVEIHDQNYFKYITVIRILAIELLNTILLLAFNDRIFP